MRPTLLHNQSQRLSRLLDSQHSSIREIINKVVSENLVDCKRRIAGELALCDWWDSLKGFLKKDLIEYCCLKVWDRLGGDNPLSKYLAKKFAVGNRVGEEDFRDIYPYRNHWQRLWDFGYLRGHGGTWNKLPDFEILQPLPTNEEMGKIEELLEQDKLALELLASSQVEEIPIGVLLDYFKDKGLLLQSISETNLPHYCRPTNGIDTIPKGLDTESRWRKLGFKIKPTARPRAIATVALAFGGGSTECALYSVEDCEPIKRRKHNVCAS